MAQLDDLWKELRKAADAEHSEHLFIASHLVRNIAWNERIWTRAEKQLRRGLREDYLLLVSTVGDAIEHARQRARSLPGPSYKRKIDHRFVAHALHIQVARLRLYYRAPRAVYCSLEPPSEVFEKATDHLAERIEKLFADPDAIDTKRVVNEGLRALGADDKWVNNVSDDGRHESTSTGTSSSP